MPAPVRALIAWSLAGAAIATLLVLAVHAARPGFVLEFDEDHPLPARAAIGFVGAGRVEGLTAGATTSRGDLRLRGVDRRVPWLVRARVRAPLDGRVVDLAIEADAVEHFRLRVPPTWTDVVVRIPPRPDRGRLILSLHSRDATGADAERGVLVDRLDIAPERWAVPPLPALAAASSVGALAGLLVSVLSVPVWIGVAALVALSSALATSLLMGVGAFAALPSAVGAASVFIAVPVAMAAAVVRQRGRPFSPATALALLLTFGAVVVKLLVFLHPAVSHGDTGFHANRLSDVTGGRLLFTSSGPGGEFPYPIGLYVLAAPLLDWQPDRHLLLRLLVALVNGLAGLALFAAALPAWGPRAALAGLALFHLVPQNLHIQGVAFLSNAFANDLAVVAMASLAAGLAAMRTPASRWPGVGFMLLATLAGVGAALSHVSSGVITIASMLVIALASLQGPGARWRSTWRVLCVTLLVAGVSWGLYYRHFMPTYRALAAVPSAAAATADHPPPAMRAEAHQTRWHPGTDALRLRAGAVPRYLRRYYGLTGLALGVTGLWLAFGRRRADALSLVLSAWAATAAIFLVVGVLTPIDFRYYLAGYPAIAAAGGLAIATGIERGGPRRLAALALLSWTTGAGGWLWWTWLHTPDL